MKLSYVVATPEVTNPEATAFRGSLEEACKELANAQYDGIELMVANPRQIQINAFRSLINRYHLEVSAVCTGEVYGQEKLSFADPQAEIREQAQKRAKEIAEFAGEFGAPINIGRLRGTYSQGVAREDIEKWARDGICQLCEYARHLGISVILEPISRLQATLVTSTEDGLHWLEKLGESNLNLMLDLFHMHLEDESVESGFIKASKHFTHVHICDTNREYPGSGHMNFRSVISVLKSLGYQGYLSAELIQVPDQLTALRRTSEFIRPLLNGL